MRVANINGRAVLRGAEGFLDVATASGGRFGPDPQQLFEDWDAFSAWAREQPAAAPTDGMDPAGQAKAADPADPAGSAGGPDPAGLADPVDPVDPADLSDPDRAVWGPPVPRPAQIFAVGLNYRDHVAESGLQIPESPAVFTKFATSLTGHDADVELPEGLVDWETELVVVIGRRAHRVSREAAWSHVAGLTVGQDLSERRLQLSGPAPQFSLGKSYPGFAPVGPELVDVADFADPDDLELGCRLGTGEVLQKSRTSNMIFGVPELIARLSAVCPLLPGDLIFTGTPAGVGGARNPQRFLAPGDVLETWIEGIGTLRTSLIAP